jgi:hypothetical protein
LQGTVYKKVLSKKQELRKKPKKAAMKNEDPSALEAILKLTLPFP